MPAAMEGRLPGRVEDDVVRLALPCEILLLYATTSSAPIERMTSKAFALATAVTRAPRCFATCTAAVPIDPEAP